MARQQIIAPLFGQGCFSKTTHSLWKKETEGSKMMWQFHRQSRTKWKWYIHIQPQAGPEGTSNHMKMLPKCQCFPLLLQSLLL